MDYNTVEVFLTPCLSLSNFAGLQSPVEHQSSRVHPTSPPLCCLRSALTYFYALSAAERSCFQPTGQIAPKVYWRLRYTCTCILPRLLEAFLSTLLNKGNHAV